jgi:hypothetical protein
VFLRIRGTRASLVETYRDEHGQVKQRHLFSLHSPKKDNRSFTFDVLRAKQFLNLTGEVWERLLASATPYLDWEEFGAHLRGEVCWTFPYGIWHGPLVTQRQPTNDWAYDL